MRFHYVASQSDGRVVEGNLDAKDPGEALSQMGARGLRPVSLKAIGGEKKQAIGGVFSAQITTSDKVFLTRYLALMLRVGTDLFHAIDILIADFDKPVVKSLLIEVRENLSKGQPFYTTFMRYPQHFSPVFVNLLKAGEASGNLEQIFTTLSAELEKEEELAAKVKAAFIYPIILLSVATLVIGLLVFFVIPKIAAVFADSNINPPAFSRIVFGIGLFLRAHILLILPSITLGGFSLWLVAARTVAGKRFVNRIVNRLPIVSTVVREVALQRFAATFGSLMKAGLPIIESLETTADAVGSDELKAALIRVSREGIAKGITVGESFRKEPFFPRVVTNLIAISEQAGHMEDVLSTLAGFYATQVDAKVKTLVALLEPLMLLVLGIIVGTIAIAIITPIYQLASSF